MINFPFMNTLLLRMLTVAIDAQDSPTRLSELGHLRVFISDLFNPFRMLN
jgi:hypothetical protein